jgi:hypothetical protein
MIEVKRIGDKVIISTSGQLDEYDMIELCKDVIQNANEKQLLELGDVLSKSYHKIKKDRPKFKGIKEESIDWKAYDEAKAQNEAKNRLHKEMQRAFVDVLDTEYLETKFATVYKLDEINREVEILRKKLNKQ